MTMGLATDRNGYDLRWPEPQKPRPDYGFDVLSEAFQKDTGGKGTGPSTYMHAVPGKGWPFDHKAEDAFELPPLRNGVTVEVPLYETKDTSEVEQQYSAVYTTKGGVELRLETVSTYTTIRTIGTFDTFADAQLAAEALNNLKGY